MTSRPYVLVTGDFVPTGGMDVANLALARHLARAGRVIDLVAYRVDPELAQFPNVSVHQVLKPANAYALGAPFLAAAGLVQGARAALAGGVVIVNGGGCPFPGINWVHYVHAAYKPTLAGSVARKLKSAGDHVVNSLTERLALQRARAIVVNSNRTRADVLASVDVPAERVHTVYYGIDAEKFCPPSEDSRESARRALGWLDGRPRMAFVGALGDRRKGFDTLYASWRALVRRPSWDADLVVVGAGSELDAWRQRASADGLERRITFLGFRGDVPTILAGCDAFVAPTRYEAYGLGVHEALCCGLPALVTAGAGVAERYPAALGILLLEEPASEAALVAKLQGWRESHHMLKGPVLALSDKLRKTTWDDMARSIVTLADSLS